MKFARLCPLSAYFERNFMMKKLLIPYLLIGCALVSQSCKKSSTESTLTTRIMQAEINSTLWTPDTVSATIVYNATTKTRLFSCSGTISQKQINVSVNVKGASTSVAIPVSTYNVDSTSNVKLTYLIQQRSTNGAYVFVPLGSAEPSAGGITISSIDTVARTITGAFNFAIKQRTYDSNGNISSLQVTNISSGAFNAMPYKYSTTN